MCSERYAELMPLALPHTQLPPTRSDVSKHVTSNPRSRSALTAVMPEDPAPITQVRGRGATCGTLPPRPAKIRPMDPETAEVRAAGCVVYRRAADGLELALVHRPRYDDWSLPKGKLDPGEDWEAAARREVLEEIGHSGPLGEELAPVRYEDRKGRDKVVRYWLMEATEGEFEPNHEVDELVWEPPPAALARLSYPTDRETVERALAVLG